MRAKGGRYLSVRNFQTVTVHATTVGVAALGMTIIIVGGGIDLSAGAAIALSATVMAYCYREGASTGASLGAAIATGVLAGGVNGALVSWLRVVPFIVTLGTMTLYQGIARILAGDTPIRAHGKVPEWMVSLQSPFPNPKWMLVAPGVWITLALAVVTAIALHRTVFGRHVFAIGSNESTARLCGVSVPAHDC